MNPGSTDRAALVVDGVRRSFGGVRAVDVDRIEVPEGRLTALIGPNGAGKSTLFNIVTGFERADSGRWFLRDAELTGLDATTIARRGMIRTFQLTRALAEMSVLDNMRLAAPKQPGERLLTSWLHPAWRRHEDEVTVRAEALLGRFRLAEKAGQRAGQLSGGQRRLLEVARSLMARPSLLLLDEPLAGVNEALREEVMAHLLSLRDDGLTILFIEHDMDAVMGLSDHVVCLATGRPIASGVPAAVAADPAVVDAYLGVADARPTVGPVSRVHERPRADVSALEPATASRPVLTVSDVVGGYHPDRPILRGVEAQLSAGEIVAVIGANGAGKSTLLKAVAGIIRPTSGHVRLGERDITDLPAYQRARLGLGYVPQSSNVFSTLTVRENLRMGAYPCRHEAKERIDRVLTLFPLLRDRLDHLAGALSGGQRQALAMARALVCEPAVLLLDEPSAGLSPQAQEDAFSHVTEAARTGVSVFIVEQNARRCLAVSDRGYVLEQGNVALTGTGQRLLHDDRVVELYLGAMKTAHQENTE